LWRGIIKGKEKGKREKRRKKEKSKEKRKEMKRREGKEGELNKPNIFYTLYIVRTPVSSANF
jgi:hypothetical protein